MLNFSLTSEQEEIRSLIRSIAMEQLRPQARSAEQQATLSPVLMRVLAQTGLTIPYAEDYGGSGLLEALTYVLVAEELGYGDAGQALYILGSMLGPLTVAIAGTAEQQALYLTPFCAEPTEHTGALAYAEATGSYTLADASASASLKGSDYLLNGSKRAVLHGAQADLRVILVRLADEPKNLAAFVLPEVSSGLTILPHVQQLGLQATPSASYILNDLWVPCATRLGVSNPVSPLRAYVLALLLRSGILVGLSRASLEYAGRYAQERRAFGRPIVSYQGIAFLLAEMAMKLDAVRLFLWQTAFSWDQELAPDLLVRDSEAVHNQALKLAKSATIDAVQILGGAGFLQDHPVEMWMRAAAAME